ncbi:MAG: hypothetical protein GX681_05420 [Clostridiaceae bacterium]|jgi:uncharacterized protein YaaQ|nr:hypothetical protein [Clostridiaceae bacterium]NLV98235.1 hypothetical protein [Clostridiaceae bacterium]
MKLIFAIVSDEDSSRLMTELNRAGHRVTKLHSTGGFLKSGNTTLMTGVEEDMQDEVMAIIRKYSRSRKTSINANIPPPSMGTSYMPYPVEVKIGGATVFVVPVDHYEKI